MKVLVTGGLGFIGSNFIIKLLENPKFEVINVDAELFGSDHNNLKDFKNFNKYEFVKGNITNRRLMEKLISKVDCVVNFAAETFVDRSISNSEPFLVSNIRGAYTILDITKQQEKRFVHISTDEVFGSLDEGTAIETTKMNPSNPYAATKASAEFLINSYVNTFDCDALITRCSNNFGPHQFPEKFIPKCIILATQEKKIPIYGEGKNIRDWIFVKDHCNAITNVLLNGKSGESYNISSDNEISNNKVVETILEIMNKSKDLLEFVEDRPGHDFRYSINSTKIKNNLNWKPEFKFSDSIELTIKWYQNNKKRWEDLNEKTFDSTPWK
tara:strand:- start:5244 stop:6224 length:981 start_codon:yes stop_codon:yes gene_type:complete